MPADLSDRTDFENAERGLIARLEPAMITTADGQVVFDADEFGLVTAGDCPETVHPSLWRHSQLTALQGLYEVTPGIYQVRGADLGNMTLVESRSGVIVIDPLTSPRMRSSRFRAVTARTGVTGQLPRLSIRIRIWITSAGYSAWSTAKHARCRSTWPLSTSWSMPVSGEDVYAGEPPCWPATGHVLQRGRACPVGQAGDASGWGLAQGWIAPALSATHRSPTIDDHPHRP